MKELLECLTYDCLFQETRLVRYPELAMWLLHQPENGVLYYIEVEIASEVHVLWYPLTEWHREQERRQSISRTLIETSPSAPVPVDANPFRQLLLQK